MIRVVYLCFTFLLLFINPIDSYSQSLRIKSYFGSVRYYGDLAPYSFLVSQSQAHPGYGFSIGVQITSYINISGKFLKGTISGNDARSGIESTRLRNLRFQSPIREFGIVTEFNIFNLIASNLNKYGVNPHLILGVNTVSFDPNTEINGQVVSLRELGTEGQELSDNPSLEKYNLNSINIPIGLGFEFRLSEKINLGIEFTGRISFTDYLDDVSTTYPNFDLLEQERGILAVALSNRADEISDNISPLPGQLRGNADNNDWYLFTGITLAYYFDENPINLKTSRPIE